MIAAVAIADAERGDQPAQGAHRRRDDHRLAEAHREDTGMHVALTGDPRQGRQHRDGEQAAHSRQVVVDRRGDAGVLGRRGP